MYYIALIIFYDKKGYQINDNLTYNWELFNQVQNPLFVEGKNPKYDLNVFNIKPSRVQEGYKLGFGSVY